MAKQKQIETEYSAAKDEFERAESALAQARARLNRAAREMCDAFDRQCADAEARLMRAQKNPTP